MKHTIIKTRRGEAKEVSGTVQELTRYFRYTLEAGHSYDSKINCNPKTAKSLVSNLNRAIDHTMAGSFSPTNFRLKEAA